MVSPSTGLRTLPLALLAGLLIVLPGNLDAQGLRFPATQDSPDTAQVDREEPAAIPESEIPLRADEAFARIRAFETRIGTDPDVQIIEGALPAELAAISDAHDRISRTVLEYLSLRELGALSEIWRGHENRLTGWRETFEHEWAELESAGSAVAAIREDWKLSRDAATADAETPREVVDRIQAVLEAADTLQAAIRGELTHLLGIEAQVSAALDGVWEVMRELDDAQVSVRGRTFQRNHPPLWQLPDLQERRAAATADQLWKDDWKANSAFLRENQERLFFHLLLLLLLILGAIRLRSRIESEAVREDETLRAAAATLSRPISVAALIFIIVSAVVYPRAPVNVWELIAVLSVIPLARLLPTSSSPLVNRTMRVLLVVFAVAAVVVLILPSSMEHRLFTLVLGTAVVVAGIVLLRGADEDQVKRSEWGRLVRYGLRGAVVVAGFAVGIGILGWSLLAGLLIYGVVYSAYLALALVVGYRVLAGIVRLLPYTSIGRSSRILSNHGDLISDRVVRALKVAAGVLWAWLTLDLFYLDEPLFGWTQGVWSGSISVGIIEFSVGKILSFLAVLLLTVWIARFIRFVLDEEVLPRLKLKRGVGNAISTVVQWTILGLGLLTAAGALGLGAQQLAIVAGALGVGIGFGLQNIVNNFVSGLILIFEQPVKVGDKIELTALTLIGEVKRIGIRSSVVRSFDGAEVIVPNANLISSEVVNWTLSDQRRRVQTNVGVAYGTDPHRVREILLAVAADHAEVLRYPEPQALFLGFGASSLDFRLLAWTADFDNFLRLRSDLATATHDALKEAGITIPFPQRDLHVKTLPASGAPPPLVVPAKDDLPDEDVS